ncbi:hypothetical protein JWH04_10580 [Xanthomonas melonis]|uniref:hypothetical protein n=1 Tax=Xanthomonas melonis TaxID=56456 RepID=UPI001E641FCC|nr:hypothetical protein [Xanthomonas melonis]MCD0279380.1 hypothetical protein [Xanthomonas melonis]
MHLITLARFDALAGYCRVATAMHLIEEQAWYESEDGHLLCVIFRDVAGSAGYQGMFLARDLAERFRAIDGTYFYDTVDGAVTAMQKEAPALLEKLEDERAQGDEPRRALDFFAPQVPLERRHTHFVELSEGEGYSPARELVTNLMHWHDDIDGNFVEQFQSAAFDARLLELYVFAMLVENEFVLHHEGAAPDFLAFDGLAQIAIEVTTVNPTVVGGQVVPPPPIDTEDQMVAYLKQYMAIKFGSALFSKLNKRYWELPHVAGKPLVFAIQDFHAPQSMTRTRTGLGIYLYGTDHAWHHDSQGQLIIEPIPIAEHRWGEKVIPSGFFNLLGAENVSAVIFNNSATLPKLNRMGFIAGFGSRHVAMIRAGFELNRDPNAAAPLPFVREVDADYHETWSEGMDIFHNPRALHPLDPRHFPTAQHHYLQDDGQVSTLTLVEAFHPLSSTTVILVSNDAARC